MEEHRIRLPTELRRNAELSALDALQQPISQHQLLMAERRHARKVAELEAELAALREHSSATIVGELNRKDPNTELARARAEVRRLQEHLKTQAEVIEHLKQAQQQEVESLRASCEAAYAEISRLKGAKTPPGVEDHHQRKMNSKPLPDGGALDELELAVDALFESWDANGDGSIDEDELQAFLIDLFGDDAATQNELDDFMDKLDQNKDSQISRKEVSAFLKLQYEKTGARADGSSIDVDNLMVAGLTELNPGPEPEREREPEPEPEPEPV